MVDDEEKRMEEQMKKDWEEEKRSMQEQDEMEQDAADQYDEDAAYDAAYERFMERQYEEMEERFDKFMRVLQEEVSRASGFWTDDRIYRWMVAYAERKLAAKQGKKELEG